MNVVSKNMLVSGKHLPKLLLALLAFVAITQPEGALASPSGTTPESMVEYHLDAGFMDVERGAELEAEEYDPQVLAHERGDRPMRDPHLRKARRTTPLVIDLAGDDPNPD
jgi:hypothetical protein